MEYRQSQLPVRELPVHRTLRNLSSAPCVRQSKLNDGAVSSNPLAARSQARFLSITARVVTSPELKICYQLPAKTCSLWEYPPRN
ncbi:hypothetical protein JTB14_020348 [Gonioctena quinquepunctata]|nr:hypothetical protein JTB14_020348 [Gonioctena quinquepunctata]